MILSIFMLFIYILKLENNKYYVGKTHNPEYRLNNHFNENGSSWTKKYKPIKILKLIPNCDNYDEDKYTIKYMDLYGINNVRGGSYCSIKLDESTINQLNKISNSNNNKCFKCGKSGHFANQCYESEEEEEEEEEEEIQVWCCSYCGKEFDSKKGAIFHQNVYCKQKSNKLKYRDYESDDESDDEVEEDQESDYESEGDKQYNKSKKSICYRCGRTGHYSNNCYASRHIKGYYIN